MGELELKTEVRIYIDREIYELTTPTSGDVLYDLAGIHGHEELFREVNGDQDDELIRRDAVLVNLFDAEHFYSQRATDIIVNAEQKEVAKRRLSFDDVVKLAFPVPPPGANLIYTVTFHRGPVHHPKGSLLPGRTVKIKQGMIFNVTATDRS